MPVKYDNVLVWGSDIEEGTVEQAKRTARLPFVVGHVALMPDAHIGFGSTVGSVIPTRGAIIPSAIGVDIGCGMAAVQLDISAKHLPGLDRFMPLVERAIPAGVGMGHAWGEGNVNVERSLGAFPKPVQDSERLKSKAISQCGSLGAGNHFFEICLDESDTVWIVLHSGSRGVGNELANIHIEGAKRLMKEYFIDLEDPDLAYLVHTTPEFDAYIGDMRWAQDYAQLNRDIMLTSALKAFRVFMESEGVEAVNEIERINCHHNFTEMENHHGKNIWVTRKGAIRARSGELGIIPGSMGTATYIVEGRGNPASYSSCSHGAGRKHSRTKAKALFNSDDLSSLMAGKVWNANRADKLVDEIPSAYKDIAQVMRDQSDLVEVRHTLRQVFNYKGV